MLDHWPSPLVVAHRGASKFAPENTLEAFEYAIQQKADAIEFDVKLTSDLEVVVIHDATVDRTTDGVGKVADFTLDSLMKMDAGIQFKETFTGVKIPTLRQVLEQFSNRIKLNIELTNYSTPRDNLVEQVISLLSEFKIENQIILSSFFPWNLKKARELSPSIPCGLLAFPGWLGFTSRRLSSKSLYEAIHPHMSDTNEHMISSWHRKGKKIYVWTVNVENEMKELLQLGVDGIITDDPGKLHSILEDEI